MDISFVTKEFASKTTKKKNSFKIMIEVFASKIYSSNIVLNTHTRTHKYIYGHHKSTIRFEFIMKHIMIGIPARSEFMTYAMASRMGQN